MRVGTYIEWRYLYDCRSGHLPDGQNHGSAERSGVIERCKHVGDGIATGLTHDVSQSFLVHTGLAGLGLGGSVCIQLGLADQRVDELTEVLLSLLICRWRTAWAQCRREHLLKLGIEQNCRLVIFL